MDIIYTNDEWLARHVNASNHQYGQPDPTCPLCIRLATAGRTRDDIIEAGIREAKEHGHPAWSHVTAYGPCTKPSRYSK